MKKFLFLAVALICQIVSWAQGVQTATLHHGDEFKSFYSATAFKEAMESAQPGDIINLSAGTFKSAYINVPVTIKGAGIGALDNTENVSKARTTLSGEFIINVPTDPEGYTLSMEGMVCEGAMSIEEVNNPIFSKMRMGTINTYGGEPKMNNVTLFHCIFDELLPSTEATFSIYNCIFPGINTSHINGSHFSIFNSVINLKSGYEGDNEMITYNNCIINLTPEISFDGYHQASLYDCLCIGGDDRSFGNSYYQVDNSQPERNNRLFPKDTAAFIDGTFYRLTDQAAKYLGNDGTQVGIYGTALPFSIRTSYPQIKKFVVAPESTADGKLKIEIEIDAAN